MIVVVLVDSFNLLSVPIYIKLVLYFLVLASTYYCCNLAYSRNIINEAEWQHLRKKVSFFMIEVLVLTLLISKSLQYFAK